MASSSKNAASSSIDFGQDEEEQQYDAELDFYSSKFNPERALWSEEVSVPYPDIKSFPSVDSYEEAVRRRRSRKKHSSSRHGKTGHDESPPCRSLDRHSKTDRDVSPKHSSSRSLDRHRSSSSRHRDRNERPRERDRSREKASARGSSGSTTSSRHWTPDSEGRKLKTEKQSTSSAQTSSSRDSKGNQAFGLKTKHSLSEKPEDDGEGSSVGNQSKTKEKRNVLTRMETMTGPLALLNRCVKEKLQVRVMTRSAVTVRGICRGYIVAFDKYYNMAMIDVDEIYRRPAVLGKVRARRSHKLLAAQKTLKKEREETQSNWKTQQESKNVEVTKTRSCFQELSILPDVSMTDLSEILSNVGQQKSSPMAQNPVTMHGKSQSQLSSTSADIKDRKDDLGHSSRESLQKKTKDISSSSSCSMPSGQKSDEPKSFRDENAVSSIEISSEEAQKRLKSVEKRFKHLRSVYEDLKAPLSPFEREALMLGIPDENVEHRHINQMLIRGENVVLVSIIDD